MEKQSQLSEVITKRILHEIKNGIYKTESKLPPELEIAAFFRVSRSIVRDSLSALEREGFISRKQGVGTIINRHVLAVVTRMDLEEEFFEMIANTGKTPGLLSLSVSYGLADQALAQKLKIQPNTDVIHVTRVIAADEQPAIYCVDSFAKSLIVEDSFEEDDLRKPIFDFLKKHCHAEVFMDLTEVKAVPAEREVAHCFQVPAGTPLLFMDEVGYNFKGMPVLHSSEYYNNGIITHMVLRKKI